MAIFVALIFQVLFVLFAMSINVALIINDKINLQNSVDLAAYYAASKQAEILSAMGHNNYQIRQSWKLLTWRTRVLGTMNYELTPHPTRATSSSQLTEVEYGGAGLRRENAPAVCIVARPVWADAPRDENICKGRTFTIPPLPQINPIAVWLPINIIIQQRAEQLRRNYNDACSTQGLWNWWFSRASLMAFRQDQANRKQVIYGLANGLSRSAADFNDLNGDSVLTGVQNTIRKNLTFTNNQGNVNIRFHNSLGGVERRQWLPEVNINPTFYFMNLINSSSGCRSEITSISQNAQVTGSSSQSAWNNEWNFIRTNLAGDVLNQPLLNEFGLPEMQRLSLGVEKNPWYMAYVGVSASTTSRQIFHPFGEPVTITARAFAKPFGGRVGPWHSNSWTPDADRSTGTKIDQLIPERLNAGGLLDDPQDPTRIPNYSRFPGDRLGLSSVLAQGSLNNVRGSFAGRKEFYFYSYRNYTATDFNDPLAWDSRTNTLPQARNFEIAAIAPDLFDITYYSIEPNYWANYGSRIDANKVALGLEEATIVRPDLGYRAGDPGLQFFGVSQQMAQARDYHAQNAFFYTRDLAHLLTSWIPGDQTNYFPPADGINDFGNCATTDPSLEPSTSSYPANPGGCVRGGRNNYSVKLVSRDYVFFGGHQLGGADSTQGPLKNPPPDGW